MIRKIIFFLSSILFFLFLIIPSNYGQSRNLKIIQVSEIQRPVWVDLPNGGFQIGKTLIKDKEEIVVFWTGLATHTEKQTAEYRIKKENYNPIRQFLYETILFSLRNTIEKASISLAEWQKYENKIFTIYDIPFFSSSVIEIYWDCVMDETGKRFYRYYGRMAFLFSFYESIFSTIEKKLPLFFDGIKIDAERKKIILTKINEFKKGKGLLFQKSELLQNL